MPGIYLPILPDDCDAYKAWRIRQDESAASPPPTPPSPLRREAVVAADQDEESAAAQVTGKVTSRTHASDADVAETDQGVKSALPVTGGRSDLGAELSAPAATSATKEGRAHAAPAPAAAREKELADFAELVLHVNAARSIS